jgi:hypothetical protein
MKERSQLGLLARRERDMRTSAVSLTAALATVSIAARGETTSTWNTTSCGGKNPQLLLQVVHSQFRD